MYDDDLQITVNPIPHNGRARSRPRQPLVHIMAVEGSRDLQSFAFHPDHASELCEAIRWAAKVAGQGRKRKPIVINIDRRAR